MVEVLGGKLVNSDLCQLGPPSARNGEGSNCPRISACT